jgi:hypothetical protein
MTRFGPLRSACCAALSAGALACSPPRDAEPAFPPGAHVQAEVAALSELLGAFEPLAATPAGQRAAELRRALPACALATGTDASGDLLGAIGNLSCDARAPESLRALRGTRPIAFAVPLGADSALALGTAEVAAEGRIAFDLRLPRDATPAWIAALLPGPEPAGPALFTGTDALIRARSKPEGGLALAELVPAASQGDQLFHLRSALFGSLILDGSLELAIYAPSAPAHWPRVALALGVRSRAAAQEALQRFLEELGQSWPLPQRATEIAGATAICLPELKLLPELAPCAQVGAAALAIGWNAESLEHALAGEPAELGDETARGAGAALAVELARIPEADALLAGRAPAAAATGGRWQRLLAGGAPNADGHALWFDLEPAAKPSPLAAAGLSPTHGAPH